MAKQIRRGNIWKATFERETFLEQEQEGVEYGHNNGNYHYGVRLIKNNNRTYSVHYVTSSEFDYCPVCGSFGCTTCDEQDVLKIHEDKVFKWLWKNGYLG